MPYSSTAWTRALSRKNLMTAVGAFQALAGDLVGACSRAARNANDRLVTSIAR